MRRTIQTAFFLALVCLGATAVVASAAFVSSPPSATTRSRSSSDIATRTSSYSSLSMSSRYDDATGTRGRILVLGGTGFLGQEVCKRAIDEGYAVTSISRRGLPPLSDNGSVVNDKVDYRQGDARQKDSIANVLMNDGSYVGIVHCVGLLFDDASGLGQFNKFASGSGSLPDTDSTYETITRVTAFNAIELAVEYANTMNKQPFPFVFTSAAEAGWPEVPGGEFIESNLAPDFLKRYLVAKRAVEAKLLRDDETVKAALRPIIFRPSLVYSMDRIASYLPVGAFVVGNKIGLPFVDRPVTVQNLAKAMIKSIDTPSVSGIQRYMQVDQLSQ